MRCLCLLSILALGCKVSFGQSNVKTVTLNKGEAFDILLLSQNPDTQEQLKSYFEVAVSVASRMTYQPIPGFKVIGHTDGNIRPNLLILGKWASIDKREEFLAEIINEVPDFHERRRDIWSYFGHRYFEVKEDYSFDIDRNKYHAANAFWLKSDTDPSGYYDQWLSKVESNGGRALIMLKDGKSPYGYQYNPDLFVITSWESETDFNAYQQKTKLANTKGLEHINEFILK